MTAAFSTRRAELIRDDLVRVAMELFVERGFDAVSVDDIAQLAGMSQRTVFRYFATKDELLLRREHQLGERMLRAIAGRPDEEGPLVALRQAFVVTSTVPVDQRSAIRQWARVVDGVPALKHRIAGETVARVPRLCEALRARAPNVNSRRLRIAVAALSAVANDAWTQWVDGDDVVDPSEPIAAAIDELVSGGMEIDG